MKKKKILALLLALTCTLSLAACDSKEATASSDKAVVSSTDSKGSEPVTVGTDAVPSYTD